jgi:hypothetical protein
MVAHLVVGVMTQSAVKETLQMLPTQRRVQATEIPDGLFSNSLPEVLRVAAELYARDREQIERAEQREELKQAAREAGLPPEYLERANALLEVDRQAKLGRTRKRRVQALIALGLALTLGAGWGVARRQGSTVMPARAALTGSILSGADLSHQNLAGQNLAMACLRGAILRGTNLRGADMEGVDVTGADLTGADLSGAALPNAMYDWETRWPTGFNPQKHGARRIH